jgi:hypothetical protein
MPNYFEQRKETQVMRQLISIVTLGLLASPALAGQISVVTPPNIVVPAPTPVPAVTPPPTPVVTPPSTPVVSGPATPPAAAVANARPSPAGGVVSAASAGRVSAQQPGSAPTSLASVQSFNVGSLSTPQAQAAVGLIQQALAGGNLSRAERQVLNTQLGQLRARLGQ